MSARGPGSSFYGWAELMSHWIDDDDDIEAVCESIQRNCPIPFDTIAVREMAQLTLQAAKLKRRTYH